MSTAATPPSSTLYHLPSASASSSRRTSLDTTTRSSTLSSPRLQPSLPPSNPNSQTSQSRRNRAALRDYYGLKAAPAQHPDSTITSASTSQVPSSNDAPTTDSELDTPGFDAQAHVKSLLEREGLEGVLRAEGGLVGEIKSLDGDRKALVYDNYSKLISATDTIRKMRSNMDPLAPTTSTLAPAIAHIAGCAEGLKGRMRERVDTLGVHRQGRSEDAEGEDIGTDDKAKRRGEEIATVKWVLGAPERYRGLIEGGSREEVEKDWKDVRILLEKWAVKGVGGAGEVTKECEAALAG